MWGFEKILVCAVGYPVVFTSMKDFVVIDWVALRVCGDVFAVVTEDGLSSSTMCPG